MGEGVKWGRNESEMDRVCKWKKKRKVGKVKKGSEKKKKGKNGLR